MRGVNRNNPTIPSVSSSQKTPLLEGRGNGSIASKSLKFLSLAFALLLLIALAMSVGEQARRSDKPAVVVEIDGIGTVPRGVSEGVSAKSVPMFGTAYPWTNAMLAWQRTAYHFQPEKNWMNGTD